MRAIEVRNVFPAIVIVAVAFAATNANAEERFVSHAWAVSDATEGLLVRDHRAPTVALYVQFPAGTWSRWGREADLSTAMQIQRFDPKGELRKRTDELSMQLQTGAASRTSWIYARFLKSDLVDAMELVRDVLANDDFDQAELKRWKRQRKISWKASQKDVQFRGRQLVARSLYRLNDPRREPFEGPRRIETDPERLREIRDQITRLPGATIAFAGDLEPDEAREIARGLLPETEMEPAIDLEPALLPLRPRGERADATTRIPRLTQVYFGLARGSVPMGDPDYPAFVLANHVLGGHFYSRISVALRHDEGDTYGAFVLSQGGVVPGPFVIGSFTRTDNAAAAETKLREAVRAFHEGGITEQERADAVGYLLGQAPFSRQAPSNVLFRRMGERRLGLPEGFHDALPRRAEELTLEAINAFIREYYVPEELVMNRVAPE